MSKRQRSQQQQPSLQVAGTAMEHILGSMEEFNVLHSNVDIKTDVFRKIGVNSDLDLLVFPSTVDIGNVATKVRKLREMVHDWERQYVKTLCEVGELIEAANVTIVPFSPPSPSDDSREESSS